MQMLVLAIHILVYGLFSFFWDAPHWLAALVFGCLLVWISITDMKSFEIPDIASLGVFVSGCAFVTIIPQHAWQSHVFAALFWVIAFWGVGRLFRLRHGHTGLGFGDVKLIAGLALWVGFWGSIGMVFAAAMMGMASMLVFALVKRLPLSELNQSAVAFAPFLCLSAWAHWLAGI